MSNSLLLINNKFPFEKISLANPQGLQGGAYFSKIRINNEPVIVQTPKCLTKNGIHKTEKKIYCDLMFDSDNEEFNNWVDTLETTIKNLIYTKRDLWFHNDMDYDSIDYHWQPLLRTYKGNKVLLRCFIAKQKRLYNQNNIQIYDEDENMLKLDDIEKDSKIISVLEISGLKFTQQSFNVEFLIKQVMVFKNQPIFNKCLIKINTKKEVTPQTNDDSDASSDVSVEEVKKMSTDDDALENNAITEITEINDNMKQIENKEDTDMEENENNNQQITEKKDIEVGETLDIENKSIDLSSAIVDDIELSNNIELSNDTINNTPLENMTLVDSNNLQNEGNNSKDLEEMIDIQTETSTPSNILEETLEKNGIISEIDLLPPSSQDVFTLKKPNEVYMEIYKEAKQKAKTAKKIAVQAYLEAKRIKSLYLLDNIESSDEEDELYFE